MYYSASIPLSVTERNGGCRLFSPSYCLSCFFLFYSHARKEKKRGAGEIKTCWLTFLMHLNEDELEDSRVMSMALGGSAHITICQVLVSFLHYRVSSSQLLYKDVPFIIPLYKHEKKIQWCLLICSSFLADEHQTPSLDSPGTHFQHYNLKGIAVRCFIICSRISWNIGWVRLVMISWEECPNCRSLLWFRFKIFPQILWTHGRPVKRD